MVPKGVRGNKRSRDEMDQIEEKVRVLMYSENPRYTDEQILAKLQIPKRTLERYRARIWMEDEPKREQELYEAMKAKIGHLPVIFRARKGTKRNNNVTKRHILPQN
jgi:hypothetical protein